MTHDLTSDGRNPSVPHPSLHGSADGSQVGPVDLEAHERHVAGLLSELPRAEAPALLRQTILAQADFATMPIEAARGAGRVYFLSSWRPLAAAAAVLIAVGAGFALTPRGGQESAPELSSETLASDLRVVEDEGLAPLHGLETFDHVGFEPGELIADWGR